MGIFPAPQCTWALSLPCLFVCHQLGVVGEGAGALLGLSWERGVGVAGASMAFVFRRAWIPLGAELGILPGACTPAHPSVPAPFPPGSHPAAAGLGKTWEVFKVPPKPFGDSAIFRGRDHQNQNLGDGSQRAVGTWIYHSKSGLGLFSLIVSEECAHFWNRFCFEICDLSGTLQPCASTLQKARTLLPLFASPGCLDVNWKNCLTM